MKTHLKLSLKANSLGSIYAQAIGSIGSIFRASSLGLNFAQALGSISSLFRASSLGLLLSCALSTGLLAPPSVLADDHQLTRSEAIEIAKKRSGNGKVLSVKKVKNKDGSSVFDVKIIVKGRVKVYSIKENR